MCRIIRQVGVINHIFPECHTISIYCLMEAESAQVMLNAEPSSYRRVSRLTPGIHPYQQTMIEAADLPT